MSNGYGYPRRRSSIFGGLLLIAIGVIFLLHYLQPGLVHLGQIIRFWPVLLIVWGLARLWDHFAANRAHQTAPPTVSGSDLLLVLLVIVGVIAIIAYDRIHRRMGWEPGFDFFETPYTFTATLPSAPVAPATRIDLWTPRGDISVHPQPSKDLNIVVTKIVRARDPGAARQAADSTTVSVTPGDGALRVEPQIPSGRDVRVSYDASVLPNTSLSASTGNGDVRVTGIQGDISLSAAGHVDVSQTGANTTVNMRRGDASIHAISGNVSIAGRGEQLNVGEIGGDVSINGEFFGPIRVLRAAKGVQFNSSRTTLSVSGSLGRLVMDSGRLIVSDSPGDVSLETRAKDIRLENVSGSVHVADRDGNVELRYSRPPNHKIDVTNRSGDIELVLPSDSSFSITAFSRSGDITSDFSSSSLRVVETTPNARLDGTAGSGGPSITLNTTYGTIHILRAPPSPPSPPEAPPTPRSRKTR